MVGVKWYVIWITWLLRIFVPYLILSFLISIVMVIPFPKRSSGVTKAYLMHTDFFTIFSVFVVYSWQLSTFCLLLGQIFSRSNWRIFFYFSKDWTLLTINNTKKHSLQKHLSSFFGLSQHLTFTTTGRLEQNI